MLEEQYESAKSTNAEVVMCGFKYNTFLKMVTFFMSIRFIKMDFLLEKSPQRSIKDHVK